MLRTSVNRLVALLLVCVIGVGSSIILMAQDAAVGDPPIGAPGPATDQRIPPAIRSTVSTGFGVYRPVALPAYRATVGATEPSLKPDFSNVVVIGGGFPWTNYFSTGERDLLVRNGFVARSEGTANFASIYAVELAPRAIGSFITVDALLHGLRVTLSEGVRDMERNYAIAALSQQLTSLSTIVAEEATRESDTRISGSLLRVLAYLETGRLLLDASAKIDPRVEAQVLAEVEKIEVARGKDASSISPGQETDYSAFTPTGSYTGDTRLATYYRARRWVSSVPFVLRSASGSVDIESARQVVLLARTLEGLSGSGNFASDYRRLDEPVKFLGGGASNGVEWSIVATAIHKYYGRFALLGTRWINDDKMMRGFVDYLAQQGGRSTGEPILFRLYNWRDGGSGSVDDEMNRLAQSPSRNFFNAFAGRPPEVWVQSLDRTLLYTLQPLAFGSGSTEGYPHFAQGNAWRDRQTASAFGAWTNFRYPVVQVPMRPVAKASSYGTAGGDLETDGYVEPNPDAWGRLASLAAYLRSGLGDDIVSSKIMRKFQDIENVSVGLMHIAARELEDADLAPQQVALIASMRDRIIAYESFVDPKLSSAGFATTAGTALLGDHSLANSHPLAIYVVVPRNDGTDGLMLTRGAIYNFQDAGGTGRAIDASGGVLTSTSYTSPDRAREVDPKKLQGITAQLPSVATVYIPQKKGKKSAVSIEPVVVELESQLVSRTSGEVWFTVRAPGRTTGLVISIVNSAGQRVKQIELGRIVNGERLDLVRINDLQNGQYYLRVEDLIGSQLAAGRFTVIE